MRRQLLAVTLLLVAMPVVCAASVAPARTSGWVWPLDPPPHVVRAFEPPTSPYGPGHRGVDLAGSVGQPVHTIASGTVTFAGSIAGRGVLVVDHGRLSSTYQPVTALVAVGAAVTGGQPVAALQLVHSHCTPDACLHLGVKHGDVYVDPLRLLPLRPIRLKPLSGLDGTSEPGHLLPPSPWADPRHEPPTGVVATLGPTGARTGLLAGRAARPRASVTRTKSRTPPSLPRRSDSRDRSSVTLGQQSSTAGPPTGVSVGYSAVS